jgi:two-component system OmpR family response regulator
MGKGDRILVVEDDPEYRQIVADVLLDAGYAVAQAADAEEALFMAAHWPPDLLLTDVGLPGITGVELTRRIHSFAPEISVVLTTGLAESYDRCTTEPNTGAMACLMKPMSVDELLWTIDSALLERASASASA